MSTADQILDQIDGALHDLAVSGDAMRSRPAEPAVDGREPLGVLAIADGADVEFIDASAPERTIHAGLAQAVGSPRHARAIMDAYTLLWQQAAPAFEQAARNAAEGVAQLQQAVEAPPHGPGVPTAGQSGNPPTDQHDDDEAGPQDCLSAAVTAASDRACSTA